jgi:hypothetical protein
LIKTLELIKMRALEMMLTPLADSISLEDRLLRLALSYREWSVFTLSGPFGCN